MLVNKLEVIDLKKVKVLKVISLLSGADWAETPSGTDSVTHFRVLS